MKIHILSIPLLQTYFKSTLAHVYLRQYKNVQNRTVRANGNFICLNIIKIDKDYRYLQGTLLYLKSVVSGQKTVSLNTNTG